MHTDYAYPFDLTRPDTEFDFAAIRYGAGKDQTSWTSVNSQNTQRTHAKEHHPMKENLV